ncbi:MAG: flagellar hook-length control protein FliK, partial [Eubacteriales bacterium]|nr:flagellar hook-length control protein FliK [Eubacteriales bacterium]
MLESTSKLLTTKETTPEIKKNFKDNDTFSKIFEKANTIYNANEQKIYKNDRNQNFFQKLKEKFTSYNDKKEETKAPNQQEEKVTDNTEEKSTKSSSDTEKEQTILQNLAAEILQTKENNLQTIAQQISQIQLTTEDNESPAEASADETTSNTTEATITQNLVNNATTTAAVKEAAKATENTAQNIKITQDKNQTETAPKILNSPVKPEENTEKGIKVSQEMLEKLIAQNTSKGSENPSLNRALETLNPVITSIKVEGDTESSPKDNEFNFNNSFNNLQSHVTKINLNKNVDFQKVLQQQKTPINEQNVLEQVKNGGIDKLAKGKTQINIALRPESLGKININIISNNGTLSAQFTAENKQAADILNKNLETLKQSLNDKGFKLSTVNVRVQEPSQSEANFNNTQGNNEEK